MNFSADFWIVVKNVCSSIKEMAEPRITLEPFVMIRDFSQRLPANVRKARPKIVILIVFMSLSYCVSGFILKGTGNLFGHELSSPIFRIRFFING